MSTTGFNETTGISDTTGDNESTGKYATVTKKIIELIEKSDTLPWVKPWKINYSSTGGIIGTERNVSTGKYYTGINAVMLEWIKVINAGYTDKWAGYKQLKNLGCKLIGDSTGYKGGYPIWYPRMTKIKNDAGEEEIRLYGFGISYVWNIAQWDHEGIEFPGDKKDKVIQPAEDKKIIEAEDVVSRYHNAPKIVNTGVRACYYPAYDTVSMPHKEDFKELPSYYKVLYHELIHSTGHRSRLKRSGIMNFDRFGSDQYSYEELIAEFGACFLSSIVELNCKVDDEKNSAVYIAGWKKRIKEDPMCIPNAARAAEKAVKYILNGVEKKSIEDVEV